MVLAACEFDIAELLGSSDATRTPTRQPTETLEVPPSQTDTYEINQNINTTPSSIVGRLDVEYPAWLDVNSSQTVALQVYVPPEFVNARLESFSRIDISGDTPQRIEQVQAVIERRIFVLAELGVVEPQLARIMDAIAQICFDRISARSLVQRTDAEIDRGVRT